MYRLPSRSPSTAPNNSDTGWSLVGWWKRSRIRTGRQSAWLWFAQSSVNVFAQFRILYSLHSLEELELGQWGVETVSNSDRDQGVGRFWSRELTQRTDGDVLIERAAT